VIWRSPSPAPRCSLHGWENNVCIHNLDTAVCCVAGTVTAVSVTQQWSCAATVRCDYVRRGSSAVPPRRCLRAHCSSARLGPSVTGHHYAARGAVTGLYAACAQYSVTRCAVLKTGGLTVVSAYLPVCQWQAVLFDLGAPGPTTALNAGRWAGDPRRASCHRHVAGLGPLPPWGAARGGSGPLPEGRGIQTPEAGWRGQARDGPAITRGGPGPPGESGFAGATRELSCPLGHAEAPDLLELREGPETMVPAVRPGPYATSPRRRGGDYG
jgi:hypothetical protein